MQPEIRAVDPLCDDALALLREAAIEARSLYADRVAADAPWPTNAPAAPRSAYLVAYLDAKPCACGALRELDAETAEVRRMFVTLAMRRRGLARAVLAALEHEARHLGYRTLRLETGDRQQAALALYAACGYTGIAAFGEYRGDATSRCLEKPVGAACGH